MQANRLRIVFMGTPELAAHILQVLNESPHHVVAAVTSPDKPAGRGRKINHSPVKQYALNHNIRLLQPTNLKSPDFLNDLQSLLPDIIVVVAFRMLPQKVWDMPELGTFNLHASLLPQYRGAAPINWAIINGERETGVTTFLIDEEIDTGNILFRSRIPIEAFETAGSLHEKIKTAGAPLVMQTIEALGQGKAKPTPQDTLTEKGGQLKKAPKIFKEDCRICWDKSCFSVVNHIHGLSPYPGAFYEVQQDDAPPLLLKVFEARPEKADHSHRPGSILTDNKTFLSVTTPDGYVHINYLQVAGKKRMKTEALLRGFSFPTSGSGD